MTSTITYGVCTVFISLYINHFLTLLPSLTKSVPDLAKLLSSDCLAGSGKCIPVGHSFNFLKRIARLCSFDWMANCVFFSVRHDVEQGSAIVALLQITLICTSVYLGHAWLTLPQSYSAKAALRPACFHQQLLVGNLRSSKWTRNHRSLAASSHRLISATQSKE